MAKSPNSTPFNGKGYSVKFTQDYQGWTETNPFISALFDLASKEQLEQTTQKEQSVTVSNELAWMDYVESEFIQDMLTYPDAEAILNKITKEIEDD